MQPPAATTPHGPGKVLLLAGGAAVAITALVVGCVVDSNWLSLLTALFYPLAVGCWLLFRPGCLCVPAGGGAALGSTGKGVFGGPSPTRPCVCPINGAARCKNGKPCADPSHDPSLPPPSKVASSVCAGATS